MKNVKFLVFVVALALLAVGGCGSAPDAVKQDPGAKAADAPKPNQQQEDAFKAAVSSKKKSDRD